MKAVYEKEDVIMIALPRVTQNQQVAMPAAFLLQRQPSASRFSVDLSAISNKKKVKPSAGKNDGYMEDFYAEVIREHKDNVGHLLTGGYETATPVNWEADGTAELTEEQISYLKSTYDLSCMDKQSYWNLMADLTNMNVISAKDVASQCIKKAAPGATLSQTPAWCTETYGKLNVAGNLWENMLAYRKDMESMKEWLLNNSFTMNRDQFFSVKDYLDYENDRTSRFEALLKLLA